MPGIVFFCRFYYISHGLLVITVFIHQTFYNPYHLQNYLLVLVPFSSFCFLLYGVTAALVTTHVCVCYEGTLLREDLSCPVDGCAFRTTVARMRSTHLFREHHLPFMGQAARPFRWRADNSSSDWRPCGIVIEVDDNAHAKTSGQRAASQLPLPRHHSWRGLRHALCPTRSGMRRHGKCCNVRPPPPRRRRDGSCYGRPGCGYCCDEGR